MSHFKKFRSDSGVNPKKSEESKTVEPKSDRQQQTLIKFVVDGQNQKSSFLKQKSINQINSDQEKLSNDQDINKLQKVTNISVDDRIENLDANSQPRPSSFFPLAFKRTADEISDNLKKEKVIPSNINWKLIRGENLSVKYAKVYSKTNADQILANLEKEVEYLGPEHSKVQVFGKWHLIPRKHAAYGEKGLTYTFSNTTLAAKCWDSCPTILELKRMAESATGEIYNFVLINRYKNGADYMGEHRDNESDLVAKSAISSFSFGQARDFLIRQGKSKENKRSAEPPIKQLLESGSLLIMEYPTNQYWYHSLPIRKNALGVRVNLTFRSIVNSSKRSK